MPNLSPAERRVLWDHMRVPAWSFVALMLMLATTVIIGGLFPGHVASYLVVTVTLVMIAVVLLFSMEVRHQGPLMRFFSLLGFAWVLIIFGMTLLDYFSR